MLIKDSPAAFLSEQLHKFLYKFLDIWKQSWQSSQPTAAMTKRRCSSRNNHSCSTSSPPPPPPFSTITTTTTSLKKSTTCWITAHKGWYGSPNKLACKCTLLGQTTKKSLWANERFTFGFHNVEFSDTEENPSVCLFVFLKWVSVHSSKCKWPLVGLIATSQSQNKVMPVGFGMQRDQHIAFMIRWAAWSSLQWLCCTWMWFNALDWPLPTLTWCTSGAYVKFFALNLKSIKKFTISKLANLIYSG